MLFATYSGRADPPAGLSPYGTVLPPNRNGPLPLTLFTGDPSFGPYDMSYYTLGYAFEHRINRAAYAAPERALRAGEGEGRFLSTKALQQPRQRLQEPHRDAAADGPRPAVVTDTSLLATFDTGPLSHQLVVGMDARRGNTRQINTNCAHRALDLGAPVYGMASEVPGQPGLERAFEAHGGGLATCGTRSSSARAGPCAAGRCAAKARATRPTTRWRSTRCSATTPPPARSA